MKANLDMLDRGGKIRIIIFTIITVLAAVYAVLCVRALCVDASDPQYFSEATDLSVDGADFTKLSELVIFGANGVFVLLNAAAYLVFSFLIDLLAYGLFRVIAFRKNDFVSNAEYILAKCAFTVILIISIVVSLFIARFNHLIYIAMLMFPIWLFGYLFYIFTLKRKRQK